MNTNVLQKKRVLLTGLFVLLLSMAGIMKAMAQIPYRQYADNGILLDFHEIDNVDFRVFLLYNLSQEDQFLLVENEESGQFSIGTNDEIDATDFYDSFETFYQNSYTDFQLLSKTDIDDYITVWKSQVVPQHFTSMMMDIILRNTRYVENYTCLQADPFCTSDFYEFESATSTETADDLEPYPIVDGCIGSSYNPSWYYLKIADPGPLTIHMEGHDPNDPSTQRDIDFCLWGPFTEEQMNTGWACQHLTTDKIIDCNYSASYTEDVFLGYPEGEHQHNSGHGTVNYHVPQTGEYYLLMITNFSRLPCAITFNKPDETEPGTTDCSLLPPIVNNTGPFCVGETILLTAIGVAGASYYWTGPNNFRTRYQNVYRPNCTMDMAGPYICTISKNGQSACDTTWVEVFPQPNASFTASSTTVCAGSPVCFTSTSTTNPSGYDIPTCNWDFGDGQTASGATQSHTYNQAGTYAVTLSIAGEGGHCTDEITQTFTVSAGEDVTLTPVTSCDSYTWYGQTYTTSGTYTHETTTPEGCLRIERLPLTINHSETVTYTQTACDSYTWHGQTYTQSGNYIFNTTTAQGCSRTETLHLTINHSETAEYNVTECDSYSWHGQTYTQSGNYVFNTTTAQGCPRTETLHLTINHSETEEYNVTECDSYSWHGQTYTQSGNYIFNTTTAQGCPRTETLHLTINHSETEEYNVTECDSYTWHGTSYTNSGNYVFNTTTAQGCPKTEILHLTINHSETEEFTDAACESYKWHGTTYTTSGNYVYETTTPEGCPRTEILHLIISDVIQTEFSQQVCDSYVWNGIPYDVTGDYTQQFTSAQNCDSIVTLHLTISDVIQNEFSEKVCDSYVWNGFSYDASGDYTQHFTTPQNCDSIVTLHLTVNHSETEDFTVSACNNYSWYGNTYTSSGDYTFETTTPQGCQRIETLHLTISDFIHAESSEQVCESYTWNGTTYNTSGDYTQEFTSAQGCDSIVTLHLTVNHNETEYFNITECDAYTWHGTAYTESGIYTFETTTPEGCERIETLYLTINLSETEEYTMTAVDSCTWHGTTYAESGTYAFDTITAQGCLRTETLHLTITTAQTFIISASAGPNGRIEPEGDVHVAPGELITFTLIPDEGCALSQVIIDGVEYAPTESVTFSNVTSDHTIRALFWGVGVEENEVPCMKISPNPAKREALVESEGMRRITLYNLSGVAVFDKETHNDAERISLDGLSSGVYVVKVHTEGNYCQYAKLVVAR